MNPRRSLSDILRAGNSGDWVDDNWDAVAPAPEFGPVPPGKYTAHLAEKSFDTSSRGTPSVKLVFIVAEGELQGRRLWLDVWLSAAAAPQARRDLAKLGITNRAQLEAPLPVDKRIRCELTVTVRQSDAGTAFNAIRNFAVVGVDDVLADPFGPDDPPAPADDAAPPPAPAARRPGLFADGHAEGNGAYRGDRL